MRYYVEVAGREFVVAIEPNGIEIDGRRVSADLTELVRDSLYVLRVEGRNHVLALRREGNDCRYLAWTDCGRLEVVVQDEVARTLAALGKQRHSAQRIAPLVAPMPGLVVRVTVNVGARVRAGQGVVVVEAMKMENELRAPADGIVSAVRVQPGTAVEKGAVLLEFEEEGARSDPEAERR
ncbi:MAG TPA: acetyl-CoA carboxylase biotin carboxyl carrier protein subunit [Gemmatimonadaceae bacterium]|nr:acetyl-CoA carboxylase biotin carboxyl carrier protein subunit [Gemmatimonadaceae bacterium]